MKPEKKKIPAQEQDRQPGKTAPMRPQPQDRMENYRAAGKLRGKRAIVTGGDSGIGRAVAIGFAREGASVAILYRDEHEDAETTKALVEAQGVSCHLFAGDIGDADWCAKAVSDAARALGGLDILVNNAAEQHPQERLEDITPQQLERTFRTNIFGMFHATKAALPHMGKGAAIVNTTSVTAYRGSGHLIDYAATKGAIVAFTRSLSENLAERGIRVNGVAPGPIWTPLIPASFDAEKTSRHGASAPMKRAGQPNEVAPCLVFLASEDASYMSGQVLHPNGGTIIP